MTTDFLFAQPSFALGMARVLDLFGLLDRYNTSPTTQEADLRALRSDWYMTQRDLIEAFSKLMNENPDFARELEAILAQDPAVAEQFRLIDSANGAQVHGQQVAAK